MQSIKGKLKEESTKILQCLQILLYISIINLFCISSSYGAIMQGPSFEDFGSTKGSCGYQKKILQKKTYFKEKDLALEKSKSIGTIGKNNIFVISNKRSAKTAVQVQKNIGKRTVVKGLNSSSNSVFGDVKIQ